MLNWMSQTQPNIDMESWASITHGRFVADCGRICGTTWNQGVKVHFLKAFHNVVFNTKRIHTFNLCFRGILLACPHCCWLLSILGEGGHIGSIIPVLKLDHCLFKNTFSLKYQHFSSVFYKSNIVQVCTGNNSEDLCTFIIIGPNSP